jgi:hypothetical protein
MPPSSGAMTGVPLSAADSDSIWLIDDITRPGSAAKVGRRGDFAGSLE